jgi:hypothetical protein
VTRSNFGFRAWIFRNSSSHATPPRQTKNTMEETPVSRPFAADDCPAIRARPAELRREQHDANGASSTDDSSRAAKSALQIHISRSRQDKITHLIQIAYDKGAHQPDFIRWLKKVGHHYGHHAGRRRRPDADVRVFQGQT